MGRGNSIIRKTNIMKRLRQCKTNDIKKNYRKMQKNQFKSNFPTKQETIIYVYTVFFTELRIYWNTSAIKDKKLLKNAKDAKNPNIFNCNFSLNSVSNHVNESV